MWTLSEGLEVVRGIQQPIRAYGYHVAIGGGVVNKGQSDKDLDLYFLPMNGASTPPADALALRAYLVTEFGTEYPLGGGPVPVTPGIKRLELGEILADYGPVPTWIGGRFTYYMGWGIRRTGLTAPRRIDVFIA